jgi:Fe-S-cluster containining protein
MRKLSAMAEKTRSRKRYNCLKCPAYCCSYAHIPVTESDVDRLADHFSLSPETARRRFTKAGDEENPRVLRHKSDTHFTTICRFVDSETRNCTVYEARPEICRDFPAQNRCGYYDFLSFERVVQEDPEWIATTN